MRDLVMLGIAFFIGCAVAFVIHDALRGIFTKHNRAESCEYERKRLGNRPR
jgi:hypothetical protein